MTQQRPMDTVTGLKNTRRSMGDGTLQGKSRIATPYRRGKARRSPASRAVTPTTIPSGSSIVEHVTLTAVSSQDIAAGGGTVQWATEGDAPNERRGFDTLATELAAGAVGDIPIDVAGVGSVRIRLPFTADVTGTLTISHVRGAEVSTIVEATGTGPLVTGGKGDVVFLPGDYVRVTLDLDESATIDDSGDLPFVEIVIWVTSREAAQWTKVADVDAWDIHNDGTHWWTTEGGSGLTVSKYDAEWSSVSSFETDYADSVRGVGSDGTYLWFGGASLANPDKVKQYDTSGTKQTEWDGPGQAVGGVASDGTDVWAVDAVDALLNRYSAAGVEQESLSIPAGRNGLALHGGKFVLAVETDKVVEVRASDGTLERTVDAAGMGGPTGVWVADDGTLYASKDGGGVWRWDGGKL